MRCQHQCPAALRRRSHAASGWQRQPDALAVQEVIEKALGTLLGEALSITGAGRTDTGVHAHQLYAHFNTEKPFEKEDLQHRLN